ncbi:dephospho-CoA kinase [Shouchella shacheensis]|uniref:dephospho-CoA kinase n=1 Tax=Shouchella shacheensis TaxID=1649580 RepID=UPI0007401E73|nr:dephospho-CoA kinase [Shouchella shacheensis]
MKIGLTGGIASGKTTVAKLFIERGIPVIDADQISRRVVEPGKAAYVAIVDYFGKDVLLQDGTIDRKKLGSIIFADEHKRKALNGMVHPAVRTEMVGEAEASLKEGHTFVVLDIPLLYENALFHLVDQVLLVYVSKEIQLSRLMTRDESEEEEAQQRINAQLPLESKRDRADAIVVNEGSVQETAKQLDEYLANWRKEIARSRRSRAEPGE